MNEKKAKNQRKIPANLTQPFNTVSAPEYPTAQATVVPEPSHPVESLLLHAPRTHRPVGNVVNHNGAVDGCKEEAHHRRHRHYCTTERENRARSVRTHRRNHTWDWRGPRPVGYSCGCIDGDGRGGVGGGWNDVAGAGDCAYCSCRSLGEELFGWFHDGDVVEDDGDEGRDRCSRRTLHLENQSHRSPLGPRRSVGSSHLCRP